MTTTELELTRRERLVEKCLLIMGGGDWWTNGQMAAALQCSETGASARIRDLRKKEYGSHIVIKRQREGRFEYRMIA